MSAPCTVPPAGWSCTRQSGHDGPCAAVLTTTWTSPTLQRAYEAVEALNDNLAQPSESPITESLRRVLDALETADCELGAVS